MLLLLLGEFGPCCANQQERMLIKSSLCLQRHPGIIFLYLTVAVPSAVREASVRCSWSLKGESMSSCLLILRGSRL